jgi:cell division protease FtsH
MTDKPEIEKKIKPEKPEKTKKPEKPAKNNNDKEPKKLNLRFFFLGLIIFLFVLSIFSPGAIQSAKYQQINFSQLLSVVNSKQVKEITINNLSMSAQGTLSDGTMFQTNIINYPGLLESLQSSGAQISIKNSDNGIMVQVLIQLIPFLIIIGIWFFIFRQAQGVNNQAMSFGKSRAKPWKKESEEKKITFKDVGGIKEAVEELEEIVDFLKNPSKYLNIGAKIPRGVLLMGPPGTGKTLLAKAIAGEADVAFFSLSASEFVEMFVGVGASRVRDLFAQAKKNQPSIVFIDEIDAVGRHRGAGFGGGHDEREQTLNQLLVELDGFEEKSSVIVIAATNRHDILDKALMRPGRFDRQIVIDAPDIEGRKEILEIHKRKKKMAPTVDLSTIAKRTPGFSGADLANIINEAALLSARRSRKTIGMKELEESIDRVIAGPQKKSKIMEEEERRTIAYHELGHAIVAKSLKATDPIHKISILPRGLALGYTLQLPEKDKFLRSETDLKNDITILMGGRAAEKVFLDDITTGASNDIKRATKTAHDIICKYGMSPLGNRAFGKDQQENVFLGRDFSDHSKDYSEKTATEIDTELNSILDACYKTAITIIKENKNKLEKIADILLKKEVLEGKEFESLLQKI